MLIINYDMYKYFFQINIFNYQTAIIVYQTLHPAKYIMLKKPEKRISGLSYLPFNLIKLQINICQLIPR